MESPRHHPAHRNRSPAKERHKALNQLLSARGIPATSCAMSYQFAALQDQKRFPLLASQWDPLITLLMGCDALSFCAPDDLSVARSLIRHEAAEWHEYGDTRWPSCAHWIEFPLPEKHGERACGILVLRTAIPKNERAPLHWVALNHPLRAVLPSMRAVDAIDSMIKAFEKQQNSSDKESGPALQTPTSAQGYCLFSREPTGSTDFIATYTDILNAEGLPLSQYRMASFSPERVWLCRQMLHALFRLNAGRRDGVSFLSHEQCQEFAPVLLDGSKAPPKWSSFHPCRTLRARPALRNLPLPKLKDGILVEDDFRSIVDAKRRERNTHMLAFSRLTRPYDAGLPGKDSNASLVAFLNRAQGGSIYVLPVPLVEEFDHTECGEVRLSDLNLPFRSVYLRFDPPEKILLGDGAFVDGCYVINQSNEYLLTLTSRLEGVNYEESLSVTCLDPFFSIHLPATDLELTVNDAVQLGIKDFLEKNAPPETDLSTSIERPDGTTSYVMDVRARSREKRIEVFKSQEASFRACLNIVVNAACFISFRPDDITDAWEGEPPSDVVALANANAGTRRAQERKKGALLKIQNGDYTRIKICGRDLFTQMRPESTGLGKSPRSHWRRGHWRRQKHGVGLSSIVLRWIRPTVVNPAQGSLVETRLYEV